ncbi:uncharacterized protein KGF55_003155 [Candida pseudojiufengensis]|uniref:uncharacterized protein n=1 Tax=Candida pseudojiufengensis TaxID=497109 RepID=UPI002224B674|nr:uncharacterized protein KGF55_003155 [Candida pseudojiufengensis]KAI5962080.1 hypothetical protein KGF55_003155 [Candida pseudojiufengensis]
MVYLKHTFSQLILIIFITFSTFVKSDFQIYKANKFESNFPVQACQGLIGKTANFFTNVTAESKIGYCKIKNQPALGTMAQCIELLDQKKNKNSRKFFLKSCKKFNLTEDQYLQAFHNATEFGFVNVTEDKSFNKTKPYYKPVLIPQKKILAAYDSVTTRWYNYNYAHWFGMSLMLYWIGIVLIASIINLIYFISPNFIKSLKGSFINRFRSYITLPALFKKTHAHHKTLINHIHILFPTRLETLIMFGWIVMAIVFCCSNYHHVSPNSIWPQKWNEMGRKIADRTGIIVIWQMPLLILFAGRNNFMQWITGFPYSRFIFFHKWIGRVVFLISIVHGVGMTYNGRGIGKYNLRFLQAYVRWGTVALVCFGLMNFQALMIFRRTNYELFLLFHIILAVFAIAGLWIHTGDQNLDQWMYCASAIWVFDRVVRISRLIIFGIHTAQVQLIANETIKVSVKRPKYWKPFPGCHAFIHFLRPTCFWQSHPFTIIDSIENENTITFYLKVKGGMTHGLYGYLQKQPDQKASIKVTIEGPYGNPIPINKFENSIFIAGGNGIPGIYYEAIDIIKHSNDLDKKTIKLYWVIRHYASLEWFYQELIKLQQYSNNNNSIEIIIYVTQPHLGLTEPITTDFTDDELEQEEEQEKKSDSDISNEKNNNYILQVKKQLNNIEFREDKPNFYEIVSEEIKETNGPLGIATCAHGSMVDDIRKSIVDHLNDSPYRIELFEQMQTGNLSGLLAALKKIHIR